MKKFIMTTIIIVLIPFFVIKTFIKIDNINMKYISSKTIKVKNEKTGEIKEIPFEEYIKGVVSGEMPANYELEALKAQAVAARSYALYHMNGKEFDVTNTTSTQVYLEDKDLKEKWKEDYEKNIKKIEKAIKETSGEYLTYKGEKVDAMFFAVSTGKTENSEEVFVSKLPYLRSVSSAWDEKSPVFTDTVTMNIKDFYNNLNIPYEEKLKIEILEKTSTGRIRKLKINGQEINGRDVQTKLKLRSNYFEIIKKDNNIIINTKGYGHGVGMSQFGANEMAKEGSDYKKILKHYYEGTEITKI